jgi:TPR repeat protein
MRRGDAGRSAEDTFLLGARSYVGDGVAKDLGEAARYFRIAADQGDATAQLCLGNCLREGEGVPRDHDQAARYCRLAADQGLADAQCTLGAAYSNGMGVPQDHSSAARYFRLAAEQGHPRAQCNYALCNRMGEGVPQNLEVASRFFRLAADQGDAMSQCELAQAFLHGVGLPQDYGEGARYHRLAADQGYPLSQLALGAMLIDDEHATADVRALEPADPRAGARLIARAAQSTEPAYEEFRLQALEILQQHADVRAVVAACCIGCGKTDGLKRCTRCHVARFCGSACMRQMWPTHKQCCKRWAESDSQEGDESE